MDKLLLTDRFNVFRLRESVLTIRPMNAEEVAQFVSSQFARPQDANEIHSDLTPYGFNILRDLHALPFNVLGTQPAPEHPDPNDYDQILIVGYVHDDGHFVGVTFLLIEIDLQVDIRGVRAGQEVKTGAQMKPDAVSEAVN